MKQVESATGLCRECGAHRRLTGSLDIERHTLRARLRRATRYLLTRRTR